VSKRRVVSRRTVKRRVVGSANPIAKWGRDSKTTCFDSIGGFFVGLLLFFVTFALPFCAARTEKDSKDVAELEVIPVAQAQAIDGKALVQGELTAASQITPPIEDPERPILAYRYALERYEPHEETRTETRTEIEGGQEVEYTDEITEEVWEWETLDSESDWAEAMLGSINVDLQKCTHNLGWKSLFSDKYTDADTGYDIRETVEVIYAGDNVILAGEFAGGQIVADADFYRLTTGTKDELVGAMHQEEETQRWVLIVLSVILWAISFNLIVGPAFILLNIIPIKAIGAAARSIFGLIALIMAVITTAVTYIVIAYWWVLALLMIVLAVVLLVVANRNREAEPDLDLPEEPEQEPIE